MPDWPPSTQAGDRHDRVVGPPRVAEATDGGSDLVHEPRNVRPSARALLSFQRPLRACAEGLSGQARSASKATSQYSGAGARRSRACDGPQPAVSRLRHPQAPVAALADLEHLAVELRRRAGRAAPPPAPSPSIRTPPCSISRRASLRLRPNCSASSAGRWTDPFGPLASTTASAISSGTSLRTCTWSKRSSAAAAASAPWKRSTSRRASSRLASPGCRSGSSSRPQQQPVVLAHRRVGDAHQLPEHLLRRIGDADVVAERLAHPPHPVGPGQDRHRQDRLRRLAEGLLHVAAEQQVELLVGPPDLDVGLDRHRVVALEHRVEQLEHRDRLPRLHPPAEVVALEQAGDREPPHQPEQLVAAHRQPLAVAADLGALRIEHLERLLLEGLRRWPSICSSVSTGRSAARPLGSPTRAV